MWGILWGLKTQAIFDVWTFEHILSGISAGHGVRLYHKGLLKGVLDFERHNRKIIKLDVVAVLFLAFAWEAVEHYLEVGLAGGAVEFWFQGVEFWANRLIADPLMAVLGYFIATRFPVFVWPARILSLTWLFIHVFIFPHSMYLHEIFAGPLMCS